MWYQLNSVKLNFAEKVSPIASAQIILQVLIISYGAAQPGFASDIGEFPATPNEN